MQDQIKDIIDLETDGFLQKIQSRMNTELNSGFSNQVTKIFKHQLSITLKEVNQSFQRGLEMFISSLDQDEQEFSFLKDTLNEVLKVTKTWIDSIAINLSYMFELDSIFNNRRLKILQLLDKIQQVSDKQNKTYQTYDKLQKIFVKVSSQINIFTKELSEKEHSYQQIG